MADGSPCAPDHSTVYCTNQRTNVPRIVSLGVRANQRGAVPMERHVRRNLALMAAISAIAMTTACGQNDGSHAEAAAKLTGAPIKFSVLYPKTGPGPAPEVLAGADAATKAINASGGVKPQA